AGIVVERGDETRPIGGNNAFGLESIVQDRGSVRDGAKDTDELARRVHRAGGVGINSRLAAVTGCDEVPGRRAAVALRAVVLASHKHNVFIGEMNAMAGVGHGDGQGGVQMADVNVVYSGT